MAVVPFGEVALQATELAGVSSCLMYSKADLKRNPLLQ